MTNNVDLERTVLAVHHALEAAGIPHAIGGALALRLYGAPRKTVDIDVNVFVPADEWPRVAAALDALNKATIDGPLPQLGVGITVEQADVARDQEIRFAWDENPVHLFFSYDELHAAMPAGIREVPFAGTTIPIVAPEHLVVRKAMLDRPKDWPDIEAILVATEPLDVEEIEGWLTRLSGTDDPRVTKLRELAGRLLT
jgi:hypothetical protein